MPTAIYVPRVNNNDDEVKIVDVSVKVGSLVVKGQVVAQVETDKAVLEVEAGSDGYVLGIMGQAEQTVQVGSVLMWVGESADEAIPVQSATKTTVTASAGTPTAKARALLELHGLTADQIPSSGDRLTVADIEGYLAGSAAKSAPAAMPAPVKEERAPDIAGELRPLKNEEKGMLATVTWHRDTAAAGYIETTFDPAPWDALADAFQKQHGLLLNPLLPLMAWRLVELCQDNPKLNATIHAGKRYEYSEVNLGFTVQAGEVLYLTVVRQAGALGELGFVTALVDIQRRAAGHRLTAAESSGATVGFSSMARWKVSRHIPILSPHTCLMVAHTVTADGQGVLGASYDHRVINGGDVAAVLRKLSQPRTAK